MNPQYDHNLPGIYQSTGYYASPSTESYQLSFQIPSWSGPQVHATGIASDICTGYSWNCPVDPRFLDSMTLHTDTPNEYYYPNSITTRQYTFPLNGISLQRENAIRGNVGRSVVINSARAAKIRSQKKHMHGNGSGYYAHFG